MQWDQFKTTGLKVVCDNFNHINISIFIGIQEEEYRKGLRT